MRDAHMAADARDAKLDIRQATLSDIPAILGTQLRTFPRDPANLDEKALAKAISAKAYRVHVASYSADFAGYIICHDRAWRPWTSLDNLIVLPEQSGKGIARALLNKAMSHSNIRPFMKLYVEKNNERAIKIYRKNSFYCARVKEGHYENNDDALILYKLMYPHFIRLYLGTIGSIFHYWIGRSTGRI